MGYLFEPFFRKHFKKIWQQRVAKLVALALFLALAVVIPKALAVWVTAT